MSQQGEGGPRSEVKKVRLLPCALPMIEAERWGREQSDAFPGLRLASR